MQNIRTKLVVGAVTAVTTVMTFGYVAGATPTEANDVIVPEITSARADLLVIAGAAVAAGAIFVAIRKGWRMFKGMIGG